MKKIILLFIAVASFYKVNSQEIKWLSFEEAISLNKENPKKILINVYTDWCGFCKKMDKNTYTNEVIASLVNTNFYPVKLNAEQKESIIYKGKEYKYITQGKRGYHELAAGILQGKLSFPSTVFLDSNEQIKEKLSGYLEPKIMEQVLVYLSDKTYETQTWEEFQKVFTSKL